MSNVIVERPSITVILRPKDPAKPSERESYDANMVQLVTHEGRYCLSFVSSGGIKIVPFAEVESVGLSDRGAQWCVACDGRLTAWPINDPSYAREIS